jgi:hypothetical protein
MVLDWPHYPPLSNECIDTPKQETVMGRVGHTAARRHGQLIYLLGDASADRSRYYACRSQRCSRFGEYAYTSMTVTGTSVCSCADLKEEQIEQVDSASLPALPEDQQRRVLQQSCATRSRVNRRWLARILSQQGEARAVWPYCDGDNETLTRCLGCRRLWVCQTTPGIMADRTQPYFASKC